MNALQQAHKNFQRLERKIDNLWDSLDEVECTLEDFYPQLAKNNDEATEPEDWEMIDPSQGGLCGIDQEEVENV